MNPPLSRPDRSLPRELDSDLLSATVDVFAPGNSAEVDRRSLRSVLGRPRTLLVFLRHQG